MVKLNISLGDYSAEYAAIWAKQNDLNMSDAIDQIISSVRRDSEHADM